MIQFDIDRVVPVCMPFEDEVRSIDFTGYRPFVAGWGYLKEGGKSSNVLQELQIPILDNETCRGRYLKQNKLFSEDQFDGRVLCAGNPSEKNKNMIYYKHSTITYLC